MSDDNPTSDRCRVDLRAPSGAAAGPDRRRAGVAVAVALWGVLGVLAVLVSAIARLTPIALEAVQSPLGPFEWALLVAWVAWMLYAEGYRGFQRGYAPRVVARAFVAGRARRPLQMALAPLFCMSLFHARRRTLIVSWSVLVGIVGLVLLVRLLSQPWRGMVDAGVVLGLTWGATSIVVLFARGLWSDRHVPWTAAALPEPAVTRGDDAARDHRGATPSATPGAPLHGPSGAAAGAGSDGPRVGI